MKQKRLKPDDRRELIAITALALAQGKSYAKVTRDEIAAQLGISGPAIQHHFGTMKQLQRSVMRVACQRAVMGDKDALRVVAQGLAERNSIALRASDEVKAKAAEALCE
jgi:AcrR family transcriptional regulator